MRSFLVILVIVGILIVLVAAFVWSGAYNVSARVPHWGVTYWLLERVRDRSIVARSKGIVTISLKEPKLIEDGFYHYHAMCRLCHSAPGYFRDEFAQGLYPSPPSLTSGHIQQNRNDAELYWIIKNGLKMTGMPAFGPTHDENEFWGLVAFLRRLPILQTDEYNAMINQAEISLNQHQ